MMSFKEFKATVCTPKVAGPHKDSKTMTTTSSTTTTTTSKTTTNKSDSAKDLTVLPTTSSSLSLSCTQSTTTTTTSLSSSSAAATSLTEETHMKLSKLFSFIDDTYRDIRRYNSGLYKDSYSTQLMKTINKYKNGCNEIFGKVLESYDMSLKLSQNIVRTIDIFKSLSSCLTDMEEYNYRICEIMSIFIVCELRLSVEAAPQDQLLIAHRIIYIMRRHLVQEEENETLYNILRTLVYIPKLFNARDIMCAIFGQFIPIKPVPEVNVLPDKLYMLYIIVFYRWMMMQKDDDDKMLIVNFAESFMKPSVSLCSNNLYGAYLPMYTTHSTATRTILNNLKYYRDIRNACMIDNALKKIGTVVNLCDDDEDDDIIVLDSNSRTDFVQAYTSVLNLEPLSGSLTNIKLEERTIVETVDLTDVEEESSNSLIERHEKWLNEFQLLAKQSRESQLLLEKQQQNKEMISTAVICLDSDSEGEENEDGVTESSRRKQKESESEKEVAATSENNKTATLNQNSNSNNCEDLFVDSYPITTTPINCDTDVESLETEEDADDETKISPRFLSGNLRTYQAKKSNNCFAGLEGKRITDAEAEAEADTELDDSDKAYRRDSIHISSTPPERVEPDEDDGTDVQDEHDDDLLEEEEETNAYTILPTTIAQKTTNEKELFAKQIRPMGPYPTYNNLHNNNSNNNNSDKVVFSQTLQRYPSASSQHQQQQHTLHQDKQYYSDGWDIKSSKKQKKKVQFNTSPLGPTTSSSTKKVPLKPALQPTKYKASDAPEYFHLRGFERFSCAPSIAGSTSTSASNSTSSSFKQQEQQESTLINLCNNNKNNNNNNKCSNLYKNLSVFKQNSLNIKKQQQQKSMKNVKINLKKLKLYNDISLTNFKSNNYLNPNEKKQEQQHEHEHEQQPQPIPPHTLNTNNIQLNLNSNIKRETIESCLLKTNPKTNPIPKDDDDKLFKKPLPVTRKVLKSPKPLKICKVVSLRRSLPYYNKINPKGSKTETIEQEHKVDGVKESENYQANDKERNLENPSNENDLELDDLSKISKLLTEEINNLTENINAKEVQLLEKPQEQENEKLNSSHQTPNETKITEAIIPETNRENEDKIMEQETNKDLINEEEEKTQQIEENEKESTKMENAMEAAQEEKEEEQEIATENPKDTTEEKENDKEGEKINEESKQEEVVTEPEQDKETSEEIEKEIVEENSKELQHNTEKDIKQKELPLEGEKEEDNKEELKEKESPENNEIKTKDGKTMEETQANEQQEQEIITEETEKETHKQNLSLEKDQEQEEEQKTTVKPQPSSLEGDKENSTLEEEKSELDKPETPKKIITNFCAEYLAGLPNEPSPALNDSTESEAENRNDMEFEFENNCTTPTIDLDVMTENTSDITSTMPLTRLASQECEADKLLEDFNHRTEDIVGTVLNKKTKECLVGDTTFKTNDELKVSALKADNDKDNLKRLRDEDNSLEDVEENKTMKKVKTMETSEEQQTENETEKTSQILVDSQTGKPLADILPEPEKSLAEMMPESEPEIAKSSSEILQETESQSPKTLTEILTEPEKPERVVRKELEEQNLNELNTPVEGNKEQENKNLPKSNNLEDSPKSHKKSSSSKKSKKSTKHSKKHEKTQSSSPNDNNEDLSKSPKQECVSKELTTEENASETSKETSLEDKKDSTAVQQMETSLNENQHMTLELGNWKQENECKTNDSESSAGVSAIFSFPKIPIISISICTTPNNKTYFKISNRENDNQTKENNKSKKTKSSPQDNETEADDIAESKEANKNKEKLSKEIPEECNEEDEEEEGEMEHEEDEEGDEEEETDNMEIEKFSHDSNSACSLPLKKRPTQAEHNEETEDSQHIIATSYEQAQEIAAEVVIENSDKDKSIIGGDNVQLQEDLEEEKETEKVSEQTAAAEIQANEVTTQVFYNTEYDDNKPSTSANCFKKLSDPSSPFKRRVHIPIRPIGQPPIQIVAPQLKDNTTSPSQDHRTVETQVPSVPMRIQTQTTQQTLPESYPATPMLSVANVEKLMDFNRFIEDLLASPDVMTIIDNANACGYYAEGQAYEMERIAILEHYNIANAKGNTSVTKPLYWKKSAGDTISIFNDNDNEWIALPPSTAKQLLKLSFVLSILQQQYKVSDVRQRINIALTFLIQTSYTSKFKNNSANNSSSLQQRMQMYSRNISDNSNQHNISSQPLPSTSYFRIATNNENLNTSFNMASNFENVQDYSNNQGQNEIVMQQDNTVGAAGIGGVGGNQQNWNNLMQFSNPVVAQVMEQTTSTNSPQRMEYETMQQQQQQQQQTQDKRPSSWEELNTDQLYINPPCATSPQNEVIVNTNGVQLHEMPQDQQNIFISITDESGPTSSNCGNAMENSMHKYNTRQQQQQQQHLRALEEVEQPTCSPSSSSSSSANSSAVAGQQQPYAKRPCLGITNHFQRNNIITTFGNQEINLKNPYRVQQLQQKQQQQQTHNQQHVNTNTNINYQQRLNISNQNNTQNLPINIYNNPRPPTTSSTLVKPQQQQRLNTATSATPSLPQTPTAVGTTSAPQVKVSESNYKEILQPYITYLIKDHEKTSKHLLQVFEEVSNSNATQMPQDNPAFAANLQQQQQRHFNSLLPPLIRNPQQNHMPGFHQISTGNGVNNLPSLIRNPHRDSGALQVVQSFIEQSQTTADNDAEQPGSSRESQRQQQQPSPTQPPGFVSEYVNFVGSRDGSLVNINLEQTKQQQQQHQQQQQKNLQKQQEIERLNSAKRKCQERNDKLAEDLKRKMMEFSMLKHNVQTKLLEKQLQGQVKQIENTNQNKRRGRPKRNINQLYNADNATAAATTSTNLTVPAETKDKRHSRTSGRVNKSKQQNNTNITTLPTTDHAYFRQRTAAREAVKRINAVVNNNFQ